jgi:hypothetical protein
MKIKTILLFVCVSLACLAVQFGIYKGIAKGAIDPCPQTTTKTSTPCPFPEQGQLIASCAEAVNCTGEYVSYSADVKNTDYKDNQPAETYTTVEEYVAPNKYQCGISKRCFREECLPYNCKQFEDAVETEGKLYTEKSCLD